MKRRVIVDTDPGIDDALALMLAVKSPEISLEGVTIVPGNVTLERGAYNALRVLDAIGADYIPVFLGANAPLERQLEPVTKVNGTDGLGDCSWPLTERSVENISAVDFLITQARLYPKELTLICLGPLTNLAQAIITDAEAMALYEEIVIFGGAARVTGNVSPVAEFNFWTDPEAARLVFSWAKVPLTVVGLDISHKVILNPIHREFLNLIDTATSQLVYQITNYLLRVNWEMEHRLGCGIHDPLAVAAIVLPEVFSWENHTVDIATDGLCRGQMVVDYKGFWQRAKNSRLAVDIKADRFLEEYIVRMTAEKLSLQEVRKYF
ncbi:MAG: nucleoside hydrolase [Firmicutes bacterium]|nr:nucleoside hydrolase [Bacillota bacterium]